MNNQKYILAFIGINILVLIAYGFLRSNEAVTPTTTTQQTETGKESEYTIIAFGDSLTAGYGLEISQSYPAQLETKLRDNGYKAQVINSGVSGETTRGNLERANFIASQESDIVIVGIGGNDALRLLSVSDARKNIEETIDILQASDNQPTILLLQMQAPLNAGQDYKQEFDAIYSAIANEKEVTLVPFLTEEIFFDPTNKIDDGIHYNESGYRKAIDAYVFPAVTSVLK